MTAFEEFGVMPELSKSVVEMGWTLPTDVQAEAIPQILGGGDVLMAAETGSGKTGAFCLPVLQITWETLRDLQLGKKVENVAKNSGGGLSWSMSLFDRGQDLAVTPDGLRCQSRHFKEWHGCRAVKGVRGGSNGCFYYEATVTDEGLCRVGFSTAEASLDLGTCRYGYGYGGTGKKSNDRNFETYGGAFGKADVIGCYLNLNKSEIYFTKNGTNLGLAFRIPEQQRRCNFFPSVVLKNAEMLFNFGDSAWKYPPKDGIIIGFSSAPSQDVVINKSKGSNSIVQRKLINNAPQAIIMEPSRELAEQTVRQIMAFKKHLTSPSVTELLVVGGTNVRDQISALKSGVDIVVATPGRLEDLISSGEMLLTQCRFFVLDEADGLLKAGYEKLINRLHSQIPKITSDGIRLQMIVCSATLHAFEVKKLAERLMHFPTWIDLKGQDCVPETVHHVVLNIDPQKMELPNRSGPTLQTDRVHPANTSGCSNDEILSERVKHLKAQYCIIAIDEHKMDRGLIFCRTKTDCDNLEIYLKQIGQLKTGSSHPYSCVCLHGDRKPAERKENLESFKNGTVKFLICTDVAARGIDIKGLPYIINVTLPDDKSNYVHRIGRVGRAERMGLAISLVSTVKEKVWYHGEWCRSRGRNCSNTNLTSNGGCCIWYNEPQLLADIEEHLGVTIQTVNVDLKIETNEFDGKVVYGQKKTPTGEGSVGHSNELRLAVAELASLEKKAQSFFWRQRLRQCKSSSS